MLNGLFPAFLRKINHILSHADSAALFSASIAKGSTIAHVIIRPTTITLHASPSYNNVFKLKLFLYETESYAKLIVVRKISIKSHNKPKEELMTSVITCSGFIRSGEET